MILLTHEVDPASLTYGMPAMLRRQADQLDEVDWRQDVMASQNGADRGTLALDRLRRTSYDLAQPTLPRPRLHVRFEIAVRPHRRIPRSATCAR